MIRRLLRVLVPASALAGLGVVACTTPTTGTANLPIRTKDGGKRGNEAEGDPDKGRGPKDGPEHAAKPDAGRPAPPGAGAACGKEPTGDACLSCCDAAFPDANTVWKRFWDACTCGGSCKSACASSVCAATPRDPSDSDTTCWDCLDRETSTCAEQSMTKCLTDPTCGGFDACAKACPDDGLSDDEETLPAPAPE